MESEERVVFDEWAYYGDSGHDAAVDDLACRDGMDPGEVEEGYSDDEIFEHAMEMRDYDREWELDGLEAFLDGGPCDHLDPTTNPNAGNRVIAAGSAGRWDRTRTGMTVYESFSRAADTSPARFGLDNVFADCEIDRIWEDRGGLHLAGYHHDGRVSFELRQLTGAGQAVLDELEEGERIPDAGLALGGRTYLPGEEGALVRAVWDDPTLCEPPRYLERAFGAPPQPVAGIELERPEASKEEMQR